jgi:hypothetical protein
MISEPLLGLPSDVKAPGSRSISAGSKAGVALALCFLCLGAATTSNVKLEVTDRGGRDTTLEFMSRNATVLAITTKPTEIPPDVLKEAVRDLNGLEGATRCVAGFLFDRDASSACAAASPALVAALTIVLSLYVLFGFAPFYMFPEAAVAFGAWKLFPMLEEAILDSHTDKNVPDTMRMGLLVTALVAFFSRLFTLWKERNEQIATGRQSSMLVSLVVGFVLYMIFNFVSLRS